MKLRNAALITPLLVLGVIAGCTRSAQPRPPATNPASGPNNVVRLDGVAGVEFGDSATELIRRGLLLAAEPGSCRPRLTSLPSVSPVFADDRLVLLWIDPPMHTPEGVTVGTPVATARAAYPAARELAAPPDTYRFDGLLAASGDRAYLFLHDGKTVRKTVVGFAEYAQRLFDDGFGTC